MSILCFDTLTIASRNLHVDWIYVNGTATSLIQLRLLINCNISLPSRKYKIISNTICSFQGHRHKNMKSKIVPYFTKSHRNASIISSGDYLCVRASKIAALRRYVSSLTGTLVRHGRFEDLSPRSLQKNGILKISVLLSLSATFSYS